MFFYKPYFLVNVVQYTYIYKYSGGIWILCEIGLEKNVTFFLCRSFGGGAVVDLGS